MQVTQNFQLLLKNRKDGSYLAIQQNFIRCNGVNKYSYFLDIWTRQIVELNVYVGNLQKCKMVNILPANNRRHVDFEYLCFFQCRNLAFFKLRIPKNTQIWTLRISLIYRNVYWTWSSAGSGNVLIPCIYYSGEILYFREKRPESLPRVNKGEGVSNRYKVTWYARDKTPQ